MSSSGVSVPELIQEVPLTASKSENGAQWVPSSLPNGDGALIFTNKRVSIKQQAVANIHGYAGRLLQSENTFLWTINFWFKASTSDQGAWRWCNDKSLVLVLAARTFTFNVSSPVTLAFASSSLAGAVQPRNAMWAFSVDGSRLSYTQPEWGDDKLRSAYVDLLDTDWHMITVRVNMNSIGMYVDGVLSGTIVNDVGNASTSREVTIDPSVMNFAIGCPGTSLTQWSAPAGTGIAKVQYWQGVYLDTTDITALYNSMYA